MLPFGTVGLSLAPRGSDERSPAPPDRQSEHERVGHAWLAEEAKRFAGEHVEVKAVNAPSGLSAIQTPDELLRAVQVVVVAIEGTPTPMRRSLAHLAIRVSRRRERDWRFRWSGWAKQA
jgi:hypothetical protein